MNTTKLTSTKLQFQSYSQEYKDDILRIFHSNCPKYFDVNDESDLIHFLENYADENYLVAFKDDELIGCGGHYTKENIHGIAWVLFERHSIGATQLLGYSDAMYREIENRMMAEGHYFDVEIHTTQLMERLFNRYGFSTFEIEKDGFGRGLDAYSMKKSLVPIT